jgi:hypothetical protein
MGTVVVGGSGERRVGGRWWLVFVSPVLWTGKKMELYWTWTKVWFIRWLFIAQVIEPKEKPVEANLGLVHWSHKLYPPALTHDPLNFTLWIIKNGRELIKI